MVIEVMARVSLPVGTVTSGLDAQKPFSSIAASLG